MTDLTRSDVKVLNENAGGPDARGVQWHIQIGESYYIVSAVDLLSLGGFGLASSYRNSETMAFPADERGEVTEWGELGFVPYKDHEACIENLLETLNGSGDPGEFGEAS